MKKNLVLLLLIIHSLMSYSQGISNLWLLGVETVLDPYTTSTKATIDFSSGSPNIIPTTRKMKFYETEGNIADANGNLLMSSNGIWIANATGDTMMNGSGLNPSPFTNSWSNYGLPIANGNLILPFPGDSSKYVLFHMTGNNGANLQATELYYTVIDMTLDGGLGGVILKNQIALQDTLTWGIGACKHANGRDWWIVVIKDNSDSIYKVLLSPNGIDSVSTQVLNVPSHLYNSTQPVFSPDGSKFAYTYSKYTGSGNWIFNARLFDFDRCTGNFTNPRLIDLTDSILGFAACFSPNSKYLYAATNGHIFQINTDSSTLYVDTIATYDGYHSTINLCNFWLMYLAADGKIYLSSGADVVDLHYINYPDSGGLSCDVHQHGLHIPCYNYATVPNHPNYFLGEMLGSPCDTLSIGINEITNNKKTLLIYPNPANDIVTVVYTTERNDNCKLEIMDMQGKVIQHIHLPCNQNQFTFYTGSILPGLYIVKLLDGDKLAAQSKLGIAR